MQLVCGDLYDRFSKFVYSLDEASEIIKSKTGVSFDTEKLLQSAVAKNTVLSVLVSGWKMEVEIKEGDSYSKPTTKIISAILDISPINCFELVAHENTGINIFWDTMIDENNNLITSRLRPIEIPSLTKPKKDMIDVRGGDVVFSKDEVVIKQVELAKIICAIKTPKNIAPPKEDQHDLGGKQKNNLLRTIAGLTYALADKSRLYNGDNINKSKVGDAIRAALINHNISTDGQANSTISTIIDRAMECIDEAIENAQ